MRATLLLALLGVLFFYVQTYADEEESSAMRCSSSALFKGALCSRLNPGTLSLNRDYHEVQGMVTSVHKRQRSPPCCAGPNEIQVAAFRAKLSDPTALSSQFSYHYSASLITDGLANGTDPLYVYTMPRCRPAPKSLLVKAM